MQFRKRWIITIIAIVLVVAVYLVFNFVRCISYYNRGIVYYVKGKYDQAISDYSKALEINPKDTAAYNNRGLYYYRKGEYDKAWEDVRKAQSLGFQVRPVFLKNLREASGREK